MKPAFTNGRLVSLSHTQCASRSRLTVHAGIPYRSWGYPYLVCKRCFRYRWGDNDSQLISALQRACCSTPRSPPGVRQEVDVLNVSNFSITRILQTLTITRSQNYETDGTPLVTNAAGDKLVFQYSRLPVTGFRNSGPNPTQPPPSQKRLEAMALLEDLAWKRSLALPRRPGDIAFINNLCLMHARKAFDLDMNGNSLPSKRHLIKLMLQDPELKWNLPDSWSWCQERIYGINQADGGRTERWEVTPGSNWAGDGTYSNG